MIINLTITMNYTKIQFPDIKLPQRDAHKLRGYFGRLFQEQSPLLHNHYADGSSIYRYPLVQYKIIKGVPTLVGLGEGSGLLTQLFLQIKELKIANKIYPLDHKHIESKSIKTGVENDLFEYQFETLWMALNQKNYKIYIKLSEVDKDKMLHRLLRNHILAYFKGLRIFIENQILVKANLEERSIQFKNQAMLGFKGSFTTNAELPNFVGIGKSVSRGFGAINGK